jgi:hypothetical protein
MMREPLGPPVVPFDPLEPWQTPQTLFQRPATDAREEQARRQRDGASGEIPVSDAHHYAKLNGSIGYTIGLSSALTLAEPVNKRNFLALRNNSVTANIYVEFGSDASLTSVFRLTPNTMILFDTVVPQDDIFAIADAASAFLSVTFSNKG